MRAMSLVVALALTAPATAATLRPLTTLDGPNVRLGDLFDDTGQDAGRVLGSAPQPGARIVVEAAQLAAIARQFGVDWRPASLADHAVIERPGRLLPRSVVIDALRTALHGVGAGEDLDGSFAPLPGIRASQRSDPNLALPIHLRHRQRDLVHMSRNDDRRTSIPVAGLDAEISFRVHGDLPPGGPNARSYAIPHLRLLTRGSVKHNQLAN